MQKGSEFLKNSIIEMGSFVKVLIHVELRSLSNIPRGWGGGAAEKSAITGTLRNFEFSTFSHLYHIVLCLKCKKGLLLL